MIGRTQLVLLMLALSVLGVPSGAGAQGTDDFPRTGELHDEQYKKIQQAMGRLQLIRLMMELSKSEWAAWRCFCWLLAARVEDGRSFIRSPR